jgi:hypothetical protein
MMTPARFIEIGLEPALEMLPAKMDSPEARAMVLAICLQESRFKHRRQMEGGPARGWAQFEHAGGIVGVLNHMQTRPHIMRVLDALGYDYGSDTSYAAIEHNDVLCAAYARLNLWWLPQALPAEGATQAAWIQYINAWRPGKPHRDTWDQYFADAWAVVKYLGRVTA